MYVSWTSRGVGPSGAVELPPTTALVPWRGLDACNIIVIIDTNTTLQTLSGLSPSGITVGGGASTDIGCLGGDSD